jgi:hypothetical protein
MSNYFAFFCIRVLYILIFVSWVICCGYSLVFIMSNNVFILSFSTSIYFTLFILIFFYFDNLYKSCILYLYKYSNSLLSKNLKSCSICWEKVLKSILSFSLSSSYLLIIALYFLLYSTFTVYSSTPAISCICLLYYILSFKYCLVPS